MDQATETTNEVGSKPRKLGIAPRGQRANELLGWLTKERVGSELIFTSEHATQVEHEFGMSSGQIYANLKNLEKKGLIARKKTPKGQGVHIVFIEKGNRPKAVEQPRGKRGGNTITEIRDAVEREIEGLQAKIDSKKQFLKELELYSKKEA